MIRVSTFFLLAAFVGLAVSSSLIHLSFPSAPAPDFVLVLVVALSLYYHNMFGLLGSFFLGLIADFASARYLGPNAAGCVTAFLFVGIVANRVYADKIFAVFIIVFLCNCVKAATGLLLLSLCVPHYHVPDGAVRTMVGEAAFSGLIAPLVLRTLRRRSAVPTSGTTTRMQTSSSFRLSSSGG